MAEVNTDSGGGKDGKKRAKKSSTRIDMTPMVDLAFLLLTFFILTATFNKQKVMSVPYPKQPKPTDPPVVNDVKNGITFVCSADDKVFYYVGEFYTPDNKKGKPATTLTPTNYSADGIKKVILSNNIAAKKECEDLKKQFESSKIDKLAFDSLYSLAQRKPTALTVVIKTDDKAVFKNVIDIIDELGSCYVMKYATLNITKPELDVLTVATAK